MKKSLNLYLVSQDQNTKYDTYDSMVVAAPDEETARNTHPRDNNYWGRDYDSWCRTPDKATVQLIGKAVNVEEGVIIASFNAG